VDDPAAGGMRAASPSLQLREPPVGLIEPNPSQPRRHFDEEALKGLAGSIGVRGVLQPVLVRLPREDGSYELLAGERRWRAARLPSTPRCRHIQLNPAPGVLSTTLV
jgi:ParB family transcriptional regulator, chromosome partitioning protein